MTIFVHSWTGAVFGTQFLKQFSFCIFPPPRYIGFRVSLTGTALELDAKFEVVKKLKLVGHPDKIFKKTAFIKGMFNSDLEVGVICCMSWVSRLFFFSSFTGKKHSQVVFCGVCSCCKQTGATTYCNVLRKEK